MLRINMNKSFGATLSGKPKIIYRNLIGKGSYGEVWSVEWGGLKAAAKRIHKEFFEIEYDQEIKDQRIAKFREECEILQSLDHDNIVKLIEVLLPENKSPVIIMELMHCDLQSFIRKSTSNPKVSPEKVISIALGVAKGLEYLHGLPNPIVHRDLMSKNILLTENGQAKIADLGVAKIFLASKDAIASPKPGALLYAAPETYKNVKNYTAKYGVKVDIFSFGVVLLEMNIGHEPRLPFSSPGKTTQIQGRQMDINEIKDRALKIIVNQCLQEKSKSRPSASKIVTDLQRLQKERECQTERCTQPVSVERLAMKIPPPPPPSSSCDYHFKVLLLGNRNVGKSSLFELLNNPTYDISTTTSTLNIRPVMHYFRYNARILKMEIVDTAGEERYFALSSSYYRNVDAVFLVYNVADKVSLQSLKFWRASLKKYNSKENLQMLLVGNKVDLRPTTDADDLVPQEHAVEYAREIQCPYLETSARDINSVMTMYNKMIEILMKTVCPEEVIIQVREEARIRLSSTQDENSSRAFNCFFCSS